MAIDVAKNKENFINILRQNVKREGINELIAWLEKSDFFTAPASTRFHLCEEGGLCEHSIHVYEALKILVSEWKPFFPEKINVSEESLAIVSLLHDLCKTGFYKVEMRNKKNPDTGKWEQVPAYVIEDTLPYGHGEKSVYIVSGFMRLTREEAMAIRWHMGFSDDSCKGGNFSVGDAFRQYTLAYLTHTADMMATNLME